MQLRQSYKQLCFVCLMIFVIGASAVVSAKAVMLPTHQMLHATMQNMSCHKHMPDHHASHKSQSDVSTALKCHDAQLQNDAHCQDCNGPSHCQNVNVLFNPQLISLLLPPLLEHSAHIHSDYQARHLAGYWQQILRPPKT